MHAHVCRYSPREEIGHAVTHGVGLVLSVVGLVALVVVASLQGGAARVVGASVFGVTLVLLYLSSTLYHGLRDERAKRVLQRVDHSAIFLLIAGTYTPFMLVSLHGGWGWLLLAVVWGIAALGITLELLPSRPARRFSLLLYLGMSWLAVVAVEPLRAALAPAGMALLVAGGVVYTLGVVFYAWRRLPYNHVVWHVFVLVGSACHFSCVIGYVIPRTL